MPLRFKPLQVDLGLDFDVSCSQIISGRYTFCNFLQLPAEEDSN